MFLKREVFSAASHLRGVTWRAAEVRRVSSPNLPNPVTVAIFAGYSIVLVALTRMCPNAYQ